MSMAGLPIPEHGNVLSSGVCYILKSGGCGEGSGKQKQGNKNRGHFLGEAPDHSQCRSRETAKLERPSQDGGSIPEWRVQPHSGAHSHWFDASTRVIVH
ncbi:hypothetical protein NHX12_017973 [Muraenolepis orangiensis]|uniref:Uncharacterized protein n=1 Tax=Muraenolepis orangiensis TaxID=630683 RepID=A0A9Q0EVW0_9TELE|nr:hypothetical protein NHX12_017973 [Muraenolepis orangiensis]